MSSGQFVNAIRFGHLFANGQAVWLDLSHRKHAKPMNTLARVYGYRGEMISILACNNLLCPPYAIGRKIFLSPSSEQYEWIFFLASLLYSLHI